MRSLDLAVLLLYLAISGMYCPACSLTVEDALSACPSVRSVQVNGATQTACVVWSPQLGRPSHWLGALQGAGYGAVPAGDMAMVSISTPMG